MSEQAADHDARAPDPAADEQREKHEPAAAAPDPEATPAPAAEPIEAKPDAKADDAKEADAKEADAKEPATTEADAKASEPAKEEPEEQPAPTGIAEAPAADAAPAHEDKPAEEPEAPPAPSITKVTPDHGPLAGGTDIVVAGEGFAEGCVVRIGGEVAATTRVDATSLRVVTPPRDQRGIAELRVVNPDGRFAIYEDDFRYDAAPVVAGTTPVVVSVEGGEVLTILGADFAQGCAVRIGGELVPCSWANAGRLEAVTKKRDAGEVEVTVENPDGQRATRAGLRFEAPPRVDAVVPASVLTAGGAEVKLSGKGFDAGTAVLLDGARVEGVLVVSENEIRFPAPPRAEVGAVDVAVVSSGGLGHRVPLAIAYTKAPPRIDGVSPDAGPSAGGTELLVKGQGFDPGATVLVCGAPAKVTWKSAGELIVTTPEVARDGLVEVRVVNADGQAHGMERAFRYVAPLPPPRLAQVGTATGSQAGGLEVALLGEDFADGCTARFGGVLAKVTFLTHKELRATTPAFNGYGEVAVEVVNPDGASSVLEAAFTYEAKPAPEITGLTPAFGPTTGGTRVVLEGKGFTRDAAVYIGREHPKDMTVKSATEIVFVTAPRKQAGVVDVEVAIPGAPRGVQRNGFRFDAVPAPVITGVSPNAGTPAGGTEMTLSGKNFSKETAVLIDGRAVKGVKLVDASTLELKTPPGEAGKMVDVTVRNPDGKEAVQKRAFLYDPRYRG